MAEVVAVVAVAVAAAVTAIMVRVVVVRQAVDRAGSGPLVPVSGSDDGGN